MQIDVLDDAGSLDRVRESWETVYAADPEAQFFLSWSWIRNSVTGSASSWLVLAARPTGGTSGHVAFLPVRIMVETAEHGLVNEIALGPIRLADYKGLICTPGFEEAAIPAFAGHLEKLHWTRLVLEGFCASDRRTRLFLDGFRRAGFTIRDLRSRNAADGVDLGICPYVELPDDWDAYLDASLSSNTRQKARRFLRKLEAGGEFRITHADGNTVERDLRILLDFWARRWGERKGDQLAPIVKTMSAMLLRCFESGSLFLPVLWKEDRPLGALACLTDEVKRTMLFHSGGRDETFTGPPPGFVLHAHAIRHAIARGFRTYDFLRGNEPYKYTFGARERRIGNIVVSTPDGRNLGGTLDRRSLPHALQCMAGLHRAGRLAQAERGYRQILEADPHDTAALFCLGQLLAAKGHHRAAAGIFRTLVALRPCFHKAWFRMAASLRAQGDIDGALACCRRAVTLEPGHREARALLSELSRIPVPA